jgi:proline dehydrogenase
MAGLMRRVLLWLARNAWLRERLPRLRFMRRAVRRFMPGEDIDAALAAAGPLELVGIPTIYTQLGENISAAAEADAVEAHYLELLERIVGAGIRGEVSVKPTQLGLDLDPKATLRRLVRLSGRAAELGSYLWIDMEGSPYVEPTIRLYERLRETQPQTGICLQAYLRRTAADVERLLPIGPAVRLVKGAYDEPASIAFKRRTEIDASFLALAVTMLRAGRDHPDRPVRLGLGTHDTTLVAQAAEHAAALGLSREAFEVEMLYGIRVREQHRLVREGFRVVALISYGTHWYPWYMRRLAERPANVLFALRQLLP